ncbi:MAG: hypothetical protein H7144_07945 [Burkholderiales bacterium]|nr:hypothetical protein [Phycisphaerae bacterium]
MTSYLPPIFSLLVAAAGWFYFLHAGRAEHLVKFEAQSDNRLRIRLRRVGGVGMMLLAVAFYVGFAVADRHGSGIIVITCMLSVLVLLVVVLFLAWVDIRLTRKMRETVKRRQK